MKKLVLLPEDLLVESFTTMPARKEKGTVFGEQCTCQTACSCPGCPTCDASCGGTCGATCDATCYGTCGDTCNETCATCEYTCAGYATAPHPLMDCVLC